MDRRKFLKSTTAAISLPFWLQGCDFFVSNDFPIHVHSDYATGHLVMQSQSWEKRSGDKVETIIVGGGLAGLSSALRLKNQDFKLFELSSRFGGTSSATEHAGISFSQGAHYDMAYPDTYGKEVLSVLEQINAIQYQPWNKSWSFTDRQHIIPKTRRQQCFEKGKWRKEVIEEGVDKQAFFQLLSQYDGEMNLPIRLIADKFKYLNNQTFIDYLNENIVISPTTKRQIDYHLLDDWGGTSDMVSALAGIHYFMCRPYQRQSVDLFSPPEGNFYFARKMMDLLPKERLFENNLVSRIEKEREGFLVEVLDISNKQIVKSKCDQVIYAGQKQSLKHVFPEEAHLFDQSQAPWMVVNFICRKKEGEFGFWQNEFIGDNKSFMGFIDSSVQEQARLNGYRILTAYYCLKPADRDYLVTIPEHKEKIVAETLNYIEEMLGQKLSVESCYMNVMGHAMAIPKKGFLFNNANDKNPNLIYSGVDNGRLPLLFEAIDSGLEAADLALNQ